MVEGGRRRVGNVGVHRVGVEERRNPLPRVEPREARIHDRRRLHQLRGAVVGAVEPHEHVEALLEVVPFGVDDPVGDGGSRGVSLGLEHLGQGHLARVEGIAELDGSMDSGELGREDRRHRRLRPGGLGDRRLEDDRVLREGRELGRRLSRVPVGRRVVGAQGVHEIDDDEGRRAPRHAQGRGAPVRALGVPLSLEPSRLEDQLSAAPGVAREVDVGLHPLVMRRPVQGVHEGRPDRVLAIPLADLHHELDPRLFLVLGWDAAGQAQMRAGAVCRG